MSNQVALSTANNLNPLHYPQCDRRGPLFNQNRMKIGIFGLNVSSAGGMSKAADRHEVDWNQNVRLLKMADEAGVEAAVPYARWRGFEGASNPWGQSLETFTWAAGVAAVTSRMAVFCTCHIFTVSPVMAAKAISTIDHISGGRVAMNVVAGWMQKEMGMFGADVLDHDARYAYADEWMEIVARLWTQEETFDFSGAYLKVKEGNQQPKSVQFPRPPVMNAGLSPAGNAYAIRWSDMVFTSPDKNDFETTKKNVDALRNTAAQRGRQLQVWIPCAIEVASTEAEAKATVSRFMDEEGDVEAMANFVDWSSGSNMSPERRQVLMQGAKQAGRGYPLIGTPDQIVERLQALSDSGIDGVCLTWLNYERGIPLFIQEVLPRLEKAGLRQAVAR